jgi:monothiol glutaredoxin
MTFKPDEPDLTNEETRELVTDTVETEEIAMFVKGDRHMPQCGYSDTALSLVHHYRDAEDVEVVNVLQNLDAFREALETHSGWETIPQVFVDGEFVGGSDILEELAERDELAETLNADPQTTSPTFTDDTDDSTDVEAPF